MTKSIGFCCSLYFAYPDELYGEPRQYRMTILSPWSEMQEGGRASVQDRHPLPSRAAGELPAAAAVSGPCP
jgi:hypothetical protein